MALAGLERSRSAPLMNVPPETNPIRNQKIVKLKFNLLLAVIISHV